MDLQANPVNDILAVSFNQDFSCFACGTESGFRVYHTDPFRLFWTRDFSPAGGLGLVGMLFTTNILALVGGGRNPKFQPNKVVLWDDRQPRAIAELSFRSTVRAVRQRRDVVVVILRTKVYVYGFRTLVTLDTVDTVDNPKGLSCLSVGPDRTVLVCPGQQQGRALVIFYPKGFGEPQGPTERDQTTIITAHESPLAAMAVDYNGHFLATASDKGTIIRVYDTSTGRRKRELRRGADRAEIHSLAFGQSGEFLAVSSDKGTVHIFRVGRDSARNQRSEGYPEGGSSNSKSTFQGWRVLPSYFDSEWSFAQFRVPDYRCIAAFGADPHTVIVLCANGSYYKARFDPNRGGEMIREDFILFDSAFNEEVPSLGPASITDASDPPTACSGGESRSVDEVFLPETDANPGRTESTTLRQGEGKLGDVSLPKHAEMQEASREAQEAPSLKTDASLGKTEPTAFCKNEVGDSDASSETLEAPSLKTGASSGKTEPTAFDQGEVSFQRPQAPDASSETLEAEII